MSTCFAVHFFALLGMVTVGAKPFLPGTGEAGGDGASLPITPLPCITHIGEVTALKWAKMPIGTADYKLSEEAKARIGAGRSRETCILSRGELQAESQSLFPARPLLLPIQKSRFYRKWKQRSGDKRTCPPKPDYSCPLVLASEQS